MEQAARLTRCNDSRRHPAQGIETEYLLCSRPAGQMSAEQMLQADVKAEEEAIELYKDIIKQAVAEKDETTRLLFEEILSAEERHHDTFTTLLGK